MLSYSALTHSSYAGNTPNIEMSYSHILLIFVFFFIILFFFFFFSSRRRHTRWNCDWSSDVCSSDLQLHSFTMLAGFFEAVCLDLSGHACRALTRLRPRVMPRRIGAWPPGKAEIGRAHV